MNNGATRINREVAKKIAELEGDLELCNGAIEDDAEDANSYYLKAGTLTALAKLRGEVYSTQQALDCYNKAVELDPEIALYRADRSNLLARTGNTEAAVEDIRVISSLDMSKVTGVTKIYINNVLKELGKLTAVQDKIKALKTSGLDSSLIDMLDKLTESSAELAININAGEGRYKAIYDEKLSKLQSIVDKLSDSQELSKAEVEKLKEKVQLHNKQIIKLNGTVNLLNSVTETMHNQLSNVTGDKAEQAEMKKAIDSLGQSIMSIATRVDAQSPVMEEMTKSLLDLQNRKAFDTKAFNGFRSRLKELEENERAVEAKEAREETHLVVKEILYDNELLNHPELLKTAFTIFGYSKTLALSSALSAEIISEAVAGDSDILLAGLTSLDFGDMS